MVPIVTTLAAKQSALRRRKREIQEDADRQIKEIDAELKNIEDALAAINKVAEDVLCSHCKGTGTSRRCDAAGQMEDVPCSACHGTGVRLHK